MGARRLNALSTHGSTRNLPIRLPECLLNAPQAFEGRPDALEPTREDELKNPRPRNHPAAERVDLRDERLVEANGNDPAWHRFHL